ncbi:MAG: Site-specific recombinase [Candidatus Daviesbacteria bacterium GW2011_GWA2_38_24]|uniref:Site-specific recombinase n=1 Tax=Candidatus Daviesbacteria bacterium GW2011_GWA2_38_24 TaxID=1618422 RepID=A0A0G0JJC3_9BACT|nr:MAG: Site-specific recombinase [Candidatus Daviesbacteria bacterium GW2011_GWA2_38_24]KKQ79965.1 MAG: Site-specific recombinase [Candidatus Daviesbacteria bacterium GW2011_GWA1_38_7]OGE24478.1 MAG: hypothetical protein A2688_02245 [Candidatus Daviesbacteria bacterium RIFCSPHIGHO2_01_FULL_38_8]
MNMKTAHNKTCVIYSRTACTVVDGKDGSILGQRELCMQTAKNFGYEVIGTYEDYGTSGHSTKRTGLTKLLNQYKQQQVDYLLVTHIDRFARNIADYFKLKEQLAQTNTKIVPCLQPELANNPLFESIFMSVAQWESEEHSRRTKLGIIKRKERMAKYGK